MNKPTSTTMKYLREREWGFVFEVKRAGTMTRRRFLFRRHGGRDGALRAAQSYRDDWHLKTFGQPITRGFKHVKRRQGSSDEDLPPRVSIARINGLERYYVVSSSDPEGQQYKTRFSIKKLGREEAKRRAIEHAQRFSTLP